MVEPLVAASGTDDPVRPSSADIPDSVAPKPVRVALVTNIPAPYRLPTYELFAAATGIDLKLFFCSGREPDRAWDLDPLRVPHAFLHERVLTWRERFIHFNPDVWSQLRSFKPDVVITTGFNPTHLLAFAFARKTHARHVAMTDGTAMSEAKLTWLHRWIRRAVYERTAAFVGASEGSLALYRQYGVADASVFKSQLCANNDAFAVAAAGSAAAARDFDFIFCGRFVAGKLPLFAIEVAAATARRLGRRTRLLLVGSGELDARMRREADLQRDLVDAHFAGFARQAQLPGHYGRARVMLFPTTGDTWGVVANEACAAGAVVFVSPQAGVAGDLVRDAENGRVLPLDAAVWADAAAALLNDANAWQAMSARSLESVLPYTYANAARGLVAAVQHADGGCRPTAARPVRQTHRVVLIQRRMTHYRVPLFERMRVSLARRGIDLEVVFGDPTPKEILKRDGGVLPWGRYVRCRYGFGGKLCLQWAWPLVRGADLTIVTQENGLLLNYVLEASRVTVPLAVWGHGRNFQSRAPNGLRERLKRLRIPRADWWFAYTQASVELLAGHGFPRDRTTVLNNAVDATALGLDLLSLAGSDQTELRRELGLVDGPVGLVLGSLYADKRIPFIIDAARRVRSQVPGFQLLIVGDGPDRRLAEAAARDETFIRYAGHLGGRDKARALGASTVMLNPFAAGLVILEGFVAGVPIVVTDGLGHGPEFAYLKHGVNCVIARAEPRAYAAAVVALLLDGVGRSALARSGSEVAQEITLDRMAERFCAGIAQCLSQRAPRRRGAFA